LGVIQTENPFLLGKKRFFIGPSGLKRGLPQDYFMILIGDDSNRKPFFAAQKKWVFYRPFRTQTWFAARLFHDLDWG
jgi:hypothetical protein